eukprot:5552619-Amphidinium_carterae.1
MAGIAKFKSVVKEGIKLSNLLTNGARGAQCEQLLATAKAELEVLEAKDQVEKLRVAVQTVRQASEDQKSITDSSQAELLRAWGECNATVDVELADQIRQVVKELPEIVLMAESAAAMQSALPLAELAVEMSEVPGNQNMQIVIALKL